MARFAAMVGALKGAGETTRLRLVALLAAGELSVKDLTQIVGQSQPRVSRHLKLLADAGLVERHAEGAWAYYRLADTGFGGELAQWLAAHFDAGEGPSAKDQQALAAIRQQQSDEASAYFATVAERWDALRSLHVPESAVERKILARFAGQSIDTLYDLGTGTGRMLELLAPHYRHGVGVDASREMLAVARAKLAAAGIGHAQVRLGDLSSELPDAGVADAVVVHQVLHYFDDPGRVMAQIGRLLKPGGRAVIVDFAPHTHEFLRTEHAHRRLGLSAQQMEGWAAGAGLAVTDFSALPSEVARQGLTVCLWQLTKQH